LPTPIQTKLVSWQLAHPLVMPVWICAVVGTGVANRLPGVERVVVAASGAAGTAPMWHVSQVVDDGMCDVDPAGEVGGIAMILLMPTKVLPVVDGPWHATQLFVMPLWLISELANRAPLPTGVVAMLEPAPTWQVSHEAVVGMWVDGSPTMLKLAAGMAKLAAALPWHWAQLPVVLGALAWMLASVGITEKSLDVWHALQVAVGEVGMWFNGLSSAVKYVVPLWHCEQSPAVGCVASATA
jgi:hypothetical protein